MRPTGHLTKWLCCGCLVLAMGAFGLCGMQTRDATNNVSGIWKVNLAGVSFSTQSDVPDHYQLSDTMTLYQMGNTIYGFFGNFPIHTLKSDDKAIRYYPTIIEGFTANGRIWLYGSWGLRKEMLAPRSLTIVGRVEEFNTIVAEFILMQFEFEDSNGDKRRPMFEGLGATGAFRAWKQSKMILVPVK